MHPRSHPRVQFLLTFRASSAAKTAFFISVFAFRLHSRKETSIASFVERMVLVVRRVVLRWRLGTWPHSGWVQLLQILLQG